MKKTLLILALSILLPSRTWAQCAQNNPSLLLQTAAVAVDPGYGSTADYLMELVNNDQSGGGCPSRTFTLTQSTGSDPFAPNTADRHMTIAPSIPTVTSVTLQPGGSAVYIVHIESEIGGATPCHRYVYATRVKNSTNTGSILASVNYYYNRHDDMGNTCQYQSTP